MIINQREDRHAQVIDVARRMMTAIRTAPKAKGNDLIETILVEGDDLRRLSDAMLALYDETSRPVYQRDAANILQGDAVVLVGIRQQPMGLNCGHCGYPGCTAKPEQSPCAFNSIDVGIAIGSACSLATDCRVDTRTLFSAGMGAMRLNLLPGCRQVLAIAVSATSKNPFFDRK